MGEKTATAGVSLRHSDREVLGFFAREGLPNVLVRAHPESRLPEQHQHGGV
ncbi:hypothetical protein ACFYT4_03755 [Streptomyces sp. NPDC004609]|uniref:hypothetical protein n=1 Tax=Streptomyces sp. NPDC004609 TaxID=3364704 RepID=UPI0036C1A0E6